MPARGRGRGWCTPGASWAQRPWRRRSTRSVRRLPPPLPSRSPSASARSPPRPPPLRLPLPLVPLPQLRPLAALLPTAPGTPPWAHEAHSAPTPVPVPLAWALTARGLLQVQVPVQGAQGPFRGKEQRIWVLPGAVPPASVLPLLLVVLGAMAMARGQGQEVGLGVWVPVVGVRRRADCGHGCALGVPGALEAVRAPLPLVRPLARAQHRRTPAAEHPTFFL